MTKKNLRADERTALDVTAEMFLRLGMPASWIAGDEPPDAWMYLDGVRRAAEVTRVTRHVRRDKNRWPENQVWRALDEAAQRIAEQLIDDARVSGEFVLYAEPINQLRSARASILEGALNYCVTTMDTATGRKMPIFGRAWGAQWCMAKVGDRETSVRWTVSMDGMGLEQGQWRPMLREQLAERAEKKSRIPARVRDGGMLILDDWFHFADHRDWCELLPMTLRDGWHTIVRVGGPNRPCILHSRDARLSADVPKTG